MIAVISLSCALATALVLVIVSAVELTRQKAWEQKEVNASFLHYAGVAFLIGFVLIIAAYRDHGGPTAAAYYPQPDEDPYSSFNMPL